MVYGPSLSCDSVLLVTTAVWLASSYSKVVVLLEMFPIDGELTSV